MFPAEFNNRRRYPFHIDTSLSVSNIKGGNTNDKLTTVGRCATDGEVASMRISRIDSDLLVHTPAKFNLSLHVLGKREDGFHNLETLMGSLRLHDSLRFSLTDSEQLTLTADLLTSSSQDIPLDASNLIIKAALLLQETTQCSSGVRIHLTKRIPTEAGLGGGSSDAAATLVCLNRLWNLNLPAEQLHNLAAQLGSDINFFLDSHVAAECTGRGEQITPVQISRPLNLVIVKPASGLSTGRVFQKWNQNEQPAPASKSTDLPEALTSGNLQRISAGVFNSLESPAKELNEEISKTIKQIEQHSVVTAGMSGSGTACFGICRSWRQAQRVAAALKNQGHPQTWAVRTGV